MCCWRQRGDRPTLPSHDAGTDLRHFKKDITRVPVSSRTEYKNMEKVFLGVLAGQSEPSLICVVRYALRSILFTMHTSNILLQIHSPNSNKPGLPSTRTNTISSIRRSELTLISSKSVLCGAILLQSSCTSPQMDTVFCKVPHVLHRSHSTKCT